jgi:hypothetical protein
MPLESSNTAHLLAELTKNAAEFNRATDSINSLIERFEDTLRNLHLGIETWISYPPLYRDDEYEVEMDEGEMRAGSVDMQLGFTKRAGEWGLALRRVVFVFDEVAINRRDLLRVEPELPLRDASRELRIAALGQFPQLLRDLNEKVKDVTQKIQAARQFVELC